MRKKSTCFIKSIRILCLLLFQFFTIALFAQTNISGKVTGAQNEGLPGISVQVQNTNFGTSTDAVGNYTLPVNLKPGTYQILISGVGFKSSTQSIRLGTAASYTVNAQLSEDVLKMDEIVVTG